LSVRHCPTMGYRGIIRAGVRHMPTSTAMTALPTAPKVASQKVSYRLPERVGQIVNSLAHRTGWSESFAAGFLVSLGYAGLRRRTTEVEARRKVVMAQVRLATVQRQAIEEGRKGKPGATPNGPATRRAHGARSRRRRPARAT